MKKRLSLLMVLMMVLSLVPMSAFATAGTMPGGTISVDDTETTHEKVTVKLTQAAGTELTSGGMAKLTLNKGEFAQDSNDATAAQQVTKVEFDFGGDIQPYYPNAASTNELTLDKAFADVAYITIPNLPEFATSLKDDMDILVSFYAYFDEEDAGDVTLAVEEMNDSNLDVSSKILIGTIDESASGDMKLSVNDDTTKISFDGGELSRVTVSDIDENDDVTYLELELPDYLNWDSTSVASLGTSVAVLESTDDDNIVTVAVTGKETLDLLVKPFVTVDKRDASTGDITLKVTARNAAGKKLETVDATIGTLVDFDVTMSAVEDGKKVMPALYGGDDTTVKVTLSGVKGSFTDGRDIDFTIDGADITTGTINGGKGLEKDAYNTSDDDGIVEDGEFTLTSDGSNDDTLEFTMDIVVDNAKDGAVVLTAESRDFGTIECDVAKVTPAYTVEIANVTPIKKGESLATADIIIKEAKAGMFDTDQFIVLNLDDVNRAGLAFGSDYKYEGTNGLKLDDSLLDEKGKEKDELNTLAIEITSSSSKEAGTITISNVMVSVSGSEVDGNKMLDTYLIEAKDDETAVMDTIDADEDYDYSVAYVNVVKEYGTIATTTMFKIGSKEYTVNGATMTANEAPFVSGKGYTMLPVRALGESLGLKADWNSNTKTATFSNDSKVASVVIGAGTMYVNGTPLKLNANAVIKNGSTFVELRSLASAFGVELQWDAATKTVTIVG